MLAFFFAKLMLAMYLLFRYFDIATETERGWFLYAFFAVNVALFSLVMKALNTNPPNGKPIGDSPVSSLLKTNGNGNGHH